MAKKFFVIVAIVYFVFSGLGFFQKNITGKFLYFFIGIIIFYYLFYFLKIRIDFFHTLTLNIISNLSVQLSGGQSSPLFVSYFLTLPLVSYKEKWSNYWKYCGILLLSEVSAGLLKNNFSPFLTLFLLFEFLLIGFVAYQFYLREDNLKKSLIKYEAREDLFSPGDLESKAIVTAIKEIDRHPGIERPLLYYVKFIHNIFKGYTTAIFAYVDGQLVLIQGFSHSELFNPGVVIDQKQGLYHQIIAEKKTVLIKEFIQDPSELGYYRGELKISSVIIAPISILDKIEGILVIDRKDSSFNEDDKAMFDIAAQCAGHLIAVLRLYEKERYEALYLSAIAELARKFQLGLELKTILADTKKSFKTVLNCDDLSIAAIDELNNQGTVLDSTYLRENTKFSLDEGLVGMIAKHKNYILKEDLTEGNLTVLKKGEKRPRGSFVGIPIKNDNEILGVIWLEDHRRKRFNEDDVRALNILGSQLALAWQRAILYERVKELSIRDGLTGLYNHRHFQEVLEEAIKKNRELILLLFDIDYFKKINDTYGHQAGDEVLKFIGRLIFQTGISARYGGEEFAIILPGYNLKKGVEMAVRLKDHINKSEIRFNQLKIKFTVSIGVAHYPKDGRTRIELIERADRALYQAKNSGRDKIVIAKSLT
ncbi:MAG: diguanylate cyclase [candidate division WOR-3 bacterium]